jgi:uncharacterized membrane protein
MSGYMNLKSYISDLRKELKGVDEALVVDAVDDATEHLEMMLEDILENGEAKTRSEAVDLATKRYGSPSLIAMEYITNDTELKEKKEEKRKKRKEEGLLQSMFNVYKDPYSYLGIFYFILLFPIGIFYFTYIVTMVSVGLGLAITIVGLPLLFLFLLSVYPIAWMHGRLTEVALGIRLPKKPRKMRARGGAWNRVKTILKDPRLYSSLLYLFLMFPLGIIYFTLVVTFLSVSLFLFVTPILALFGIVAGYPVGLPGDPVFQFGQAVVGFILGFLVLTWTLHVVNLLGTFQGCLSRWLLLKR